MLATGATKARDVNIPGRELKGIHLAMTYLPLATVANLSKADGTQTRTASSVYGGAEVGGEKVGEQIFEQQDIHAQGKHVIVIGAGDTAADCIGTAHRQKAASVTQLNIYPKPPDARTDDMPWPAWPNIHRTSPAHEEGGTREYAVTTKRFIGDADGRVKQIVLARQEVAEVRAGKQVMREVPGSEYTVPCDLCLIAIGFTGPESDGLLQQLGLELDARGSVKVDENYASSVPGVFATGDCRRGQSLVVWAISEGRCAAASVGRVFDGGNGFAEAAAVLARSKGCLKKRADT